MIPNISLSSCFEIYITFYWIEKTVNCKKHYYFVELYVSLKKKKLRKLNITNVNLSFRIFSVYLLKLLFWIYLDNLSHILL